MINKNNLTTLASLSSNYNFENGYSVKNKSKEQSKINTYDKKDTVIISSKTEDVHCRELRVSEIKEKVKNGEYKIDNKLTSSAIIEELKLLK